MSGRSLAHHAPDGGFLNPWPDTPARPPGGIFRWALIHRTTRPVPVDPPRSAFARVASAMAHPRGAAGSLTITWVGHSTFLVQLGQVNVLTDPMWSARASPISWLGPRRWVPPAVELESLPPIDVVIVSHNHYDHLDGATVGALAALYPVAEWLAPLGVGDRLRRMGARRVREMDWWSEAKVGALDIVCTPARHFAGRGVLDRGRALWCGWTLAAEGRRVFFAGDTAYHPDFGAIGTQLGPFDAALMPIGGYEPRWYMQWLHLDPEEAVRAFMEVTASAGHTVMVPMHWGTFKLADEAMDEPPRRVQEAWRAAGLPPEDLWLLKHGETRALSPAVDASNNATARDHA